MHTLFIFVFVDIFIVKGWRRFSAICDVRVEILRNETKTGVVVKGKIGLIHAMFSSKIIDTVVVHGSDQMLLGTV